MQINSDLLDWALKAIITGCVIYGVRVLSKLQTSVEGLNIKIATVITRVTGHEKEIDKHDKRIRHLEITKEST